MSCIKLQAKVDGLWCAIDTFVGSDIVTVDVDPQLGSRGVRVSTALRLEIPYNSNKIKLDQFINENRSNKDCVYVETRIFDLCGKPLAYSHFYVSGRNLTKAKKSYTITFTNRLGDPIELAKTCALCDFNIGTFEFTKENILQSWQNHKNGMTSTSNVPPVVFPLTYRGDTYCGNNEYGLDDVIPYFHPLALIRDMFCEKGYSFETSLWDDPMWQKNYLQSLSNDYGGNRNFDPEDYKFLAENNQITPIIPLDRDGNTIGVGDPGFLGTGLFGSDRGEGYWYFPNTITISGQPNINNSNYFLSGSTREVQEICSDPCLIQDITIDFKIKVNRTLPFASSEFVRIEAVKKITTTNGNAQSSISFVVAFTDLDTSVPNPLLEIDSDLNTITGSLTVGSDLFSYCSSDNSEECICFRLCAKNGIAENWSDDTADLLYYRVRNNPIERKYCDGDIVNYSDVLPCDKSLYDLLSEVAAMTRGRLIFNSNENKLLLYPEFSTEFSEGYFKEDEYQDITHLVSLDTIGTEPVNKDLINCQIFGFKESNDPCIRENPLYENGEPYDYKHVEGTENEDCPKKRLKCIEPTVLKEVLNDNTVPVHLACTTDGGEGVTTSFEGWRIGQFVCAEQTVLNDSGNAIGVAQIIFCGDVLTDIPTIVQSLENENVTIVGYDENCALTWQNLWEKYIARGFLGDLKIDKSNLSLRLSCYDYHQLDKRKTFVANLPHVQISAFLDQLRFSHCKKSATLTLKSPEDNVCDKEEILVETCRNFPELFCAINPNTGCIETMLGGVNNSVVQTVLFEADLFDQSTNQFPNTYAYPVTQTSLVSAEICDAGCRVRIRMTVSYEDGSTECAECDPIEIVTRIVKNGVSIQYEFSATGATSISGNVGTNTIPGGTNAVTGGYVDNQNPTGVYFTLFISKEGCEYGQYGNTIVLADPPQGGLSNTFKEVFLLYGTPTDCGDNGLLCPPITRTVVKDPCGNNPIARIICREDPENCDSCYTVMIDNVNAMSAITGNYNIEAASLPLTFTLAPDGLSATSEEICIDPALTFTLEDYEIEFEGPCKNWISDEPISKKYQNCCCKPSGICKDCVWTWDNNCGRKVTWYRITDFTDQNVVPYGLMPEEGNDDSIAKEDILCTYPVSSHVFLDDWDGWYIAVMDGGTCGCLLFPYYHDAPQSGTVIPTINV